MLRSMQRLSISVRRMDAAQNGALPR